MIGLEKYNKMKRKLHALFIGLLYLGVPCLVGLLIYLFIPFKVYLIGIVVIMSGLVCYTLGEAILYNRESKKRDV